MRILYFISNISRKSGGIYQYSLGLIKALARSQDDNTYYVYANEPDEELTRLSKEYEKIVIINKQSDPEILFRFIIRVVSDIINLLGIRLFKRSLIDEISIYRHIIKKYKIDILHFPYQQFFKIGHIPVITTIHDLQELHFPEFFSSEVRASRAVGYKNAIDNANAIVVSYEHVRQDIVKYFSRNSEDIYVCLLDMQELWFDRFSNTEIIELNHLGVPDNYILYPAVTWPHKNHENLIMSLKLLKDESIEINLVCTGKKTEDHQKIQSIINQLGLNKQVYFTGVVDDKTLFSLYKNTLAVVIPTLYEAGSFPLMESVLMNIPVICSNVTSLPQTIGDSRFIFDPLNSIDIKEKIKSIVMDENYREANKSNNIIQGGKLRNNNVALKVKEVYKRVLMNSQKDIKIVEGSSERTQKTLVDEKI